MPDAKREVTKFAQSCQLTLVNKFQGVAASNMPGNGGFIGTQNSRSGKLVKTLV